MIIYKNIRIFFGGIQYGIDKNEQPLNKQQPFEQVAAFLSTEKIYFLDQVHSVKGMCIDQNSSVSDVAMTEGDFLVTNQRGSGLAIFTADCVPIVIYDFVHNCIAMIHAGWRGIVGGIISNVVSTMQIMYETKPEQVEVFIGPAARRCCYFVQNGVYKMLKESINCADSALFDHRNEGIFLDLPSAIEIQLVNKGIVKNRIQKQFSWCTLCNTTYYSYRREKSSMRNINVCVIVE